MLPLALTFEKIEKFFVWQSKTMRIWMTWGWVKDHKTLPLIPTQPWNHSWLAGAEKHRSELNAEQNIILLKVYTQREHLRLGAKPVSNWNDLTWQPCGCFFCLCLNTRHDKWDLSSINVWVLKEQFIQKTTIFRLLNLMSFQTLVESLFPWKTTAIFNL